MCSTSERPVTWYERVFEHKHHLAPGFTSRYNLTRLVYYETFFYPDAAIEREKELKDWLRKRKIEIIETLNPHWHDLAECWYGVHKPDERPARDPSLRLNTGCAQDDPVPN